MQKPTYGRFGGQFVPEVLMPALNELEEEYERYKGDPGFLRSLTTILQSLPDAVHLYTMQGI